MRKGRVGNAVYLVPPQCIPHASAALVARAVRAELLSVGTELLLGQIVDTNSAYLAGRLAGAGIDCLHMTTVGDNLDRAVEAIRRGLGRSELLVMTGGLGPTEDDLTREAIGAALGESPAVDADLARELSEWFSGRGAPMPQRNVKQAWLIPSAVALPNPNGTAPGWDVRHDGTRIIAMPGVPREMMAMWENSVEPTLFAGAVLRSRTLKLLGMGESAVEEALGELVHSLSPTVATYAKNDGVHVRLTDKDANESAVLHRVAQMEQRVRQRVGDHIWGTDAETLGSVIGAALRSRGWRLASAEALSAGELAQALAGAGAGAYAGGVVRPGAALSTLAAAIDALGVEASVLVPAGDEESRIVVRTPEREGSVIVRFRSESEGRRRSVLGALDLLRRALL